MSTFYESLVQHVAKVLEEHDAVMYTEQRWILSQALDKKQLVTEGTLRSALYKKLDDVVLPILSEIIGFLDQNYNLNLINAGSLDETVSRLWMSMFAATEVLKFTFQSLFPERVGRSPNLVPGIGSRCLVMDFKCHFPFSWVVKGHVDILLRQALQLAGKQRMKHFLCQICEN